MSLPILLPAYNRDDHNLNSLVAMQTAAHCFCREAKSWCVGAVMHGWRSQGSCLVGLTSADEGAGGACWACKLATPARDQLYIVDDRPQGNACQGQCVPRLQWNLWSVLQIISGSHALGCQEIWELVFVGQVFRLFAHCSQNNISGLGGGFARLLMQGYSGTSDSTNVCSDLDKIRFLIDVVMVKCFTA